MAKNGHGDVGPADVMKRRYGWTAENWKPPVLRQDVVPPNLHDLIPLAGRFGVTCDVTRHDVAAKATDAELDALKEELRGRHEEIWDFLYSIPDGAEIPTEVSAFQALLVFELEERQGRGIPGSLTYWLGKCRREPIPEHSRRLAQACEETKSLWMSLGPVPENIAKELKEAQSILAAG